VGDIPEDVYEFNRALYEDVIEEKVRICCAHPGNSVSPAKVWRAICGSYVRALRFGSAEQWFHELQDKLMSLIDCSTCSVGIFLSFSERLSSYPIQVSRTHEQRATSSGLHTGCVQRVRQLAREFERKLVDYRFLKGLDIQDRLTLALVSHMLVQVLEPQDTQGVHKPTVGKKVSSVKGSAAARPVRIVARAIRGRALRGRKNLFRFRVIRQWYFNQVLKSQPVAPALISVALANRLTEASLVIEAGSLEMGVAKSLDRGRSVSRVSVLFQSLGTMESRPLLLDPKQWKAVRASNELVLAPRLSAQSPRTGARRRASVILPFAFAPDSFYHSIVDSVPAFLWFLANSQPDRGDTVCGIPPSVPAAVRHLMGVVGEKLGVETLDLDSGRMSRLGEKIVVLTSLNRYSAIYPESPRTFRPYEIHWPSLLLLRQFMKEHVIPDVIPTQRTVVVRAQDRFVGWKSKWVHPLVEDGFEAVDPGILSWHDQVSTFAGSAVIVGESGSALTNLLFARDAAKVFVLHAGNPLYVELATCFGLDVADLPGNPQKVLRSEINLACSYDTLRYISAHDAPTPPEHTRSWLLSGQ